MHEYEILYDPSTTTYTETIWNFLLPMPPDERQRQVSVAMNNLLFLFQHIWGSVCYSFNLGKPFVATSDAFFEQNSQRLTAVVIGELSQAETILHLRMGFMLPEEVDRRFGSNARPFWSEFDQDLADALISLNEERIRAICKLGQIVLPPESFGSEPFWLEVHKMREATPAVALAERQKSKRWLDERNVVRPPSPHSLDETPSLRQAYPIGGVLYIQPVYQMLEDGTFTTWLELIKDSKVVERIPIKGFCRSEVEANQVGLKAMEKMVLNLQKKNPKMTSIRIIKVDSHAIE